MANSRRSISAAAAALLLAATGYAQCLFVDPPPPPQQLGGGGGSYASWNGWYLPTSGTLRILVVLIEQDGAADSPDWPAHQLPIWVDNPDPNINLFDHNVPSGTATGLITRYFQDASSGQFNVIADYLKPDNATIFHTNGPTGSVSAAIAAVNSQASGFLTGHGFTSVAEFDKFTAYQDINNTYLGLPKPNIADGRYDHVMFVWRMDNTNINNQGWASKDSPGALLGHDANTHSLFYSHNGIPIDIMRHEFSHLLYGGNNFHAGGGGYNTGGQFFITRSNGWSNMGLYDASLNSWNAWDRQRMGWKAVGQTFVISARTTGSAEVNGDLDATVPSDAGTYVLRDFVQTGDALRIKLPFTDPNNEFPEFLWVENHQGIDQNANPFDKWQYEGQSCIQGMVPGLQMYVQVGKETRESTTSAAPIYGEYCDYLRPLDASGHFDETFDATTQTTTCVCWQCPTNPFARSLPNPFTGSADRHFVSQDLNANGSLSAGDFRSNAMEDVSGVFHDNLYCLGNSRQAFTPSGNHKLSVGTNPSSATMMNSVGYNNDITPNKNLRRIYLNGVSVALLAQNTDGSITVQVRFDDVDVNNNARWCADEIQLNPVATSTGYSLNVTAGNTITLDRGTTATRRNNPETYGGQQVFTSATLMRCPANTWLNLDPNSNFVVDGGSTLRLESGSRMDVGNGAVLRVKRGSRLELMGGSVLNVLPGGQVIIEESWQPGDDGRLVYYPNARINLEASNSVLEFAGVLDIQANATFTPARSGDPNTTYGLVKFTNTSPTSYNVAAGANSRFIMRGTNPNGRILHVQQESLYGPTQLVEFSLLNAKATLADNARIVPPVTNSAIVKFDNATVTSSTGVRNTHRGVRLNGQALLTLNNSTFSMGSYGVYSYNTMLGNSPAPVNCSFLDCNTGMYNYDKGIKAISCKFDKCTNGLQCVQMAHTSYLIDCSAQRNAQTGVSFSGSSTLNVKNPAFNYNAIGLSVGQATAVVACGSVSLNELYGFQIHHGGTLRMDDNHTGHDPVTAVKNGTSIYCQQANNVYLDLGLNSLKPMVPGYQKSLYGTFLCAPYSVTQPARKNNWNGTVGTPLTSADYSITTCGAALLFDDPSSSAEITCGQVPLSVPVNNEIAMSPMPAWMENCIGCAMVMSADSVLVPLNLASMAALDLGYNDSLPDNELLALAAFHALLASPVTDPGAQEKFLLEYGHGLMQESFGDALEKGQLDPATDNANMDTHLAMMTNVEDARAGAAAAEGQDDFVFYTSLQRAQLTRATGKLDDAIDQMQAIPQPPDTGQQALLSTILCYTRTELAVTNGTYEWDEVEAAMLSCTGHGGPKLMMQPVAEGPDALPMAQPTLQPNPAASEVRVQGFAGEDCLLRLLDITGRTVVQEVQFNNSTTLPLQAVRPGTYLCRITSSTGQLWTGRLVVAR